MNAIAATLVKELRDKTGASVMECKRALEEEKGDLAKATEWLRRRGHEQAAKRSDRATKDGRISTYVHHNGRIASMVELGCETDFVSKGEEFQALLKEICLQVASMRPRVVSREQLPKDEADAERARFLAETEGKPAEMKEKIVAQKLEAWYGQVCLVDQPTALDPAVTIGSRIRDLAARVGENLQVVRFARFEVGQP